VASRHWEILLMLYHKDYRQEGEFENSLASINTGYGLTSPKRGVPT
jgi:hypothetical protein